ncbi:GNAT family acetyltransferase [Curvibacter gracilis]|uniref:GNAT family acetyltransferase n=1 Tax=Curvibacter gracilis TaxID=230310 RepID=UPI0004AFE92F|nr:GNAT family acetyltransferase [Curvibacter gracilis]
MSDTSSKAGVPERAPLPGLTIRVFHPADEPAAVALWGACGLLRPWNDPHKDIARKLAEQPELFLVAVLPGAQPGEAERLIGTVMAGYDGHRGWVYYLAVDPAWQRHSLGRLLMQRVEAQLLALGCPKINLMVRSENTAVLDFYARLGFSADASVSLGKRLIPDA